MKNNTQSHSRAIGSILTLKSSPRFILICLILLVPLVSGETLRETNNQIIEGVMDFKTNLVSNSNQSSLNNSEANIQEDMINPFLLPGIIIAIVIMFLFFKLYKNWDGDYQA